jgi:TrmH family RNA methyltransferase
LKRFLSLLPLYKLVALPKHQFLRKAAKIFGEAEHRLIASGELPADEIEYLKCLAKLLADEEGFPPPAAELLANTAEKLNPGAKGEIRRSLNGVYHFLLSETGRYQADWDFFDSCGSLDPSKRRPFAGMHVYLEDIRSPFNVGSMFRAAESFGAEKIWLSPLCADPRHKRAERTAMGCVDVLPWERLSRDPFTGPFENPHPGGGAENCPAGRFAEGHFFALETGGTTLEDFSFPQRGILIAGSEELGVSPGALAAADTSLGRVSITSYGAKGSLNVSVAFGIVMQAWACSKSTGHYFTSIKEK